MIKMSHATSFHSHDGEMDEMLRGIKFEIMTENIFFQRLASYVTRGVLRHQKQANIDNEFGCTSGSAKQL